MQKTVLHRIAAAGAGATLLAAGMSVATNGVAHAEESSSECSPSADYDLGFGLTDRDFKVSQEATPSEVAPGSDVTVETTIYGDGGLVNVKRLRLNAPEGSRLVSATLDGDDKTGDVKKNDPDKGAFSLDGTWGTTNNTSVTYEVTVTIPEDVDPGDTLAFGAGASVALSGSNDWNDPDDGACVTVRDNNPVESVEGSLGDLGFGDSLETGSASVKDPAGSIGDVVDNLNIGKIIGEAIGS